MAHKKVMRILIASYKSKTELAKLSSLLQDLPMPWCFDLYLVHPETLSANSLVMVSGMRFRGSTARPIRISRSIRSKSMKDVFLRLMRGTSIHRFIVDTDFGFESSVACMKSVRRLPRCSEIRFGVLNGAARRELAAAKRLGNIHVLNGKEDLISYIRSHRFSAKRRVKV